MPKCAECGYLAVQSTITLEWMEAGRDYRETGFIPWDSSQPKYPSSDSFSAPFAAKAYKSDPACFRGACDFRSELEQMAGPKRDAGDKERKEAFAKERDCGKFREWQLGFTPKEHLEMDLLERQQRWQESQEAKADARHRATLFVALVAAAIGMIGALLAVWVARWIGA